MDALMYLVFPSSLVDLKLKWFDKLSTGLTENFHQLTESFMARLLKAVGYLLTLRKGKNKVFCNYSKRYWETYNEIKECSEELAMASYKLELIPRERL